MKYIDEFVYVDSRPYSPFGRDIHTNDNGHNKSYDHTFIKELDALMHTNNMRLCVTKDHKRVYSDGKKTIFYYVNTSIPEDFPLIEYELQSIDTLIVARHDPHHELMTHFRHPIHFIGFEDTFFGEDSTRDDSELIYWLHRNKYHDKFINFSYMFFERYFSMRKQTFETWNEFVNQYSYYNMCNM